MLCRDPHSRNFIIDSTDLVLAQWFAHSPGTGRECAIPDQTSLEVDESNLEESAQMSLEKKIVSIVETYLASFEKRDLDTIIGLFAEDAWIEDPVGTERRTGHEALRAFYQFGIDMGARGALESEIRVAGNEAAFAFSMTVDTGKGLFTVRPIDVMTFNEEGEITSMRAYFGPLNQGME